MPALSKIVGAAFLAVAAFFASGVMAEVVGVEINQNAWVHLGNGVSAKMGEDSDRTKMFLWLDCTGINDSEICPRIDGADGSTWDA
ncbi:uncharacterized protein LY89DRAFT_728919 [Mollisia scopiformis]|uniref:Uncharacterized protein n=1 Tax=Mollisia scopiformis TaxID=149040 RepID=A0A194XR90_MOLSC|nr:uncharacterized protein LY89DRAFT_728919 [Mollisia scopiformis]KUJ22805.1 hypothetical protein LY89DRAFT_728919 [Mollisia scopiformis]